MGRLNQQAAHLGIPLAGDGAMPLPISGFSDPGPQPQAGPDISTAVESLTAIHPADKRQTYQRPDSRNLLKPHKQLISARLLDQVCLEPFDPLAQLGDHLD